MRKAMITVSVAALALGACASTQERRIESGLRDLGLPGGLSECMAERMVENLSGSQLRRVADYADALDEDIGDMRVEEVIDRFGGIGDAEVLAVMGRAAAGCVIAG